MALDLFTITEQLKNFVKNESDTFLGLVSFFSVSLIGVQYLLTNFFTMYEMYFFQILIASHIIIFILWFNNRRLKFSKQKISISIANFNVISLDIKSGVEGQKKIDLKNELKNYLYDSLKEDKKNLDFQKYIDIITLPNRIEIDDRNIDEIKHKINTDIIIYGTIRYNPNNKIFIEPRFKFVREPHGLFYKKFRDKILNKEVYSLNLSDENISIRESPIRNLVHYLNYIGVLFYGIKKLNHNKFEEAEDAFKRGIDTIIKIDSPTKELEDIYLSMNFYQGKNFHKWGKYLEEVNLDKESSKEKYKLSSKVFFGKLNKKIQASSDEREFLKNSYFYGIHLLIKEGNLKEAKKKIDKIEKKFKENPDIIREKIEYLEKKDVKKLKEYIKKLTEKKLFRKDEPKENQRIYEKIGNFYYKNKQYKNAEKYLNRKKELDKKDIYAPTFLDIKTDIELLKIHIKNLEALKSEEDIIRIIKDKVYNLKQHDL